MKVSLNLLKDAESKLCKVLQLRYAEWTFVFNDLVETMKKHNGDELILNLITFPILYYDTS